MDGDTWDKVSEFLANSFESNIKEIKISDYIAFCLKNAKIRYFILKKLSVLEHIFSFELSRILTFLGEKLKNI